MQSLPLHETTFVVVDLETTGGSPHAGAVITEFGAVKVRGGEVLGEFKTFVNPCTINSWTCPLVISATKEKGISYRE